MSIEDNEFIAEAFARGEAGVRRGIVHAIETRGHKPDGELLLNWGKDNPSGAVEGEIIEALGALRYEPAVPYRVGALNKVGCVYYNSKVRVCDMAVNALKRINTSEALEAIAAWETARSIGISQS